MIDQQTAFYQWTVLLTVQVRAPLADLAPSISVVKTTDLIYVFCAAAWVNVVTGLAPTGLNIPAFLILMFTFSQIPLELYTNHLWEAVVSLYEQSNEAKDRRNAIISALDIIRIFFLVMSFELIAYPVDYWTGNVGVQNYSYNMGLFSFCTGIFIVMNSLWNFVVFNGYRRFAANPYDVLFESFRNEVLEKGSDYWKSFFVFTTSIFKWVNYILFRFCFPIVGVWLIIVPMLTIYTPAVDFVMRSIAWSSMTLYLFQFAFKLFQIVFVSMVYGGVRAVRTASLAPITS